MRSLWSLICGVLFAVGLGISGMMNPHKVIGFLDIFGNWDPSLAFVMIGAIGVYIVAHPLSQKILKKPLLDEKFHQVTANKIDKKLVIGEVIFGIGWGMTGICPGPALSNITVFSTAILIFVGSMIGGMLLFNLYQRVFAK